MLKLMNVNIFFNNLINIVDESIYLLNKFFGNNYSGNSANNGAFDTRA